MKPCLYIILAFCPLLSLSQDKVEGKVMEADNTTAINGLPGASVYWMDSPTGTVTDADGLFSIPYKKEYDKLIISYVGFEPDTLTINGPMTVRHFLQPSNELDEVVLEQKRKALQKSHFSARIP
ncbi:carboxypeptidase-like regulatory domain-containing protein [Pricia sp. S334]|uniref:Carboxypeptidase-like regulatory domain-containing protein n=1 Tax=Pricia mediterranea TaxID=3076079 RepID=A0ABU3L6B7_9FLAO|nr:carboxypeptidase-like regulatory domain-containing protein [Pricia sp. S334]MDT7829285.1 carboxypeptidase-like regulatory domain-containing protein [Pricia sp. S334]